MSCNENEVGGFLKIFVYDFMKKFLDGGVGRKGAIEIPGDDSEVDLILKVNIFAEEGVLGVLLTLH